MKNGDASRERPGREAPKERSAPVESNNPPEGQTDWAYLEAMTGEEAHRNALADPDNPPSTPEQLARVRRIPNPKHLRLKFNLSQEELARQFQIGLYTLRDWEQGIRRPDSVAKAYLRVIEAMPDAVRQALDPEPGERGLTADEAIEPRKRRAG
jgi:putative transcriptional regulator